MKFNSKNSFHSLDEIISSGKKYKIFNLKKAEQNGLEGVSKLPKSLKVLLENLLRYEDDLTVDSTPKRFRADITRGDLCAGNVCVKLPIEGVGLFDGVYLGEQIRIGQNLNESGALVVQVRSKI
jgi:hypothetical protein